jgi:hypothetical protein
MADLPDNVTKQISDIAGLLLRGRCRFFIGAGIPKEGAGLPDYSGLAAQVVLRLTEEPGLKVGWMRKLVENNQLISGLNPAQVFELLREELPQTTLVSAINNVLELKEPLGSVYQSLRKLAMKQRPTGRGCLLDYIYTTNFDLTLEHQFGGTSTKVSPERLDGLRQSYPVKVVHLNGALGDTNLKISERDDLLSVTAIWSLHSNLGADLVAKHLVFVGYSLQDVSIKFIFLAVNEVSKFPDNQHWLVNDFSSGDLASKNEIVLDFHEHLWETRRVKLLNLRAGVFFEQLLRQVDYHEHLLKAADIGKEKNISETLVLERAERLREKFPVLDEQTTLNIVEALLPEKGD